VTTADPVVSVRDLEVTFATKGWGGTRVVRAVQGVDLDIAPGRTLGVAGESGSGKSTVARALMRITPVQAGRMSVAGRDVTHLRGRALRGFRRQMQMVFQDPYDSLNPRLTVGDSVSEALGVAGVRRPDQSTATRELFERVGLPASFAGRYPHQLSGGQRQRVSIARALAVDPQVIICDEAVSALDVSVRAQILNLLKDLQQASALSYLFISHDLSTLRFLVDDVAIMYFGRIVEIGSRDQVFAAPAHPYTRALFAAIPEPASRRVRPRSRLAGEPPSQANPPSGCPFHPRCPLAQQICREQRPALTTVPGGQRAACHFPVPGPVDLAAPTIGPARVTKGDLR
jgi:oligopeptide/dipeptide ABC transporter ATP-binding protein